MPLMIIESPNKIKKLTKILGSGFKVMATVGHFLTLQKKNMGFDHETFEPSYKLDPKKSKVISEIKKEAKNHDIIYIATDPDREGEAIAKHIEGVLPKRGKKIFRVTFNAITKEAVKKAIKNAGAIDENLYLAQTARRLTDRIVGYKVSPVMWKKGLVNTSAGRVQSVALKHISEREKEVIAFKPQDYWSFDADFTEGFTAELYSINKKKVDVKSKKDATATVKDVSGCKDFKISSYKTKSRELKPKPPFTTSTLQQDASNKMGWPSKKTMGVAQSLFGAGLITYHRTDSVRIEDSKITELRTKIDSMFGKSYLPASKIDYGSGTQDAHEAIRPTYEQMPTNLLPDEKKLLKLITNRFVASQMSNAKFDEISIEIESSNGKNKYLFKAKGSSLVFDGFLKVYGDKSADKLLPSLKASQKLNLKVCKDIKHTTKPPPRYSDASLVKKLEKEGVGRPSTYASIIDTLESRKYITRKGKMLSATEVGIIVSDYLCENFNDIVDTGFTANMEEALDKISSGSLEYAPVMKAFFDQIKNATEGAIKKDLPKSFITEHKCPDCSSNTIKRISKFGAFLGCTAWPECSGTLSIDGKSKSNVEVDTGMKCDCCGNIMLKRTGSSGDFWGCKSFPDCKNTVAIIDENSEKCEKCNEGVMVKRKGKYGYFLGCSSYPKCKNLKKIKKS